MGSITDRIPYSAIVDRPALKLPGGAQIAVWVIVNVEEWSIERPMPRTVLPPPMGQPLVPDVPNWAWHEYGMRVGFWRFLKALKDAEIKATMAVNGSVCSTYPRVAEAALEADWEFMGHGFIQRPMHQVQDQWDAISKTFEVLKSFSGKSPRGWESPGMTETGETLDILKEVGFEYIANWVLDDQPVQLTTRHGPIYSVPYTVEINDIAISALQEHTSDILLKRGRDQFDRLYEEGVESARVMAISLHPYITGVPHRIKYLEELLAYIRSKPNVAFMKGEEILDWYKEQTAGVP